MMVIIGDASMFLFFHLARAEVSFASAVRGLRCGSAMPPPAVASTVFGRQIFPSRSRKPNSTDSTSSTSTADAVARAAAREAAAAAAPVTGVVLQAQVKAEPSQSPEQVARAACVGRQERSVSPRQHGRRKRSLAEEGVAAAAPEAFGETEPEQRRCRSRRSKQPSTSCPPPPRRRRRRHRRRNEPPVPARLSPEPTPERSLGRCRGREERSEPHSVSSRRELRRKNKARSRSWREPPRKKQAGASSWRELRMESPAPRSETASSGEERRACCLRPWPGIDAEAPGGLRRHAWREYKRELVPERLPPDVVVQLADRAAARFQKDIEKWRNWF